VFEKKMEIAIVSFPLGEAGGTPLLNLTSLLKEIASKTFLISGGDALKNLTVLKNIFILKVEHKQSSNVILRIFNFFHTDLKILCKAASIHKNVDFFVFFIGGETLPFSMMGLKLLKKKVLLTPGGIATKGYLVRGDPLAKLVSLLTNLNLYLADKIILYSHRLIVVANWSKWQFKTLICHEHFVDLYRFKIIKEFDNRENTVGYIGRFSKEKGILNFVQAMQFLLKEKSSIQFLLCGSGELLREVKKSIKNENLGTNVKLRDWIPHEKIPELLNELKLLILPSYIEGLPNIMLEAMACGTPVLATPVGAIPDIIKDGETGFLLRSNDPKHIADKIIELLNKPELLEKVSKNAYNYVRENFSYRKTLESWRKIIREIEVQK